MASPGAPLCESCHAPLDVKLDEASRKSGRSSVACSCGENATYETPEAARQMAPLLATICTEHRTDRRDVKVDATESAIAVRCPGCDAPLQASEGTKFITCTYCHTQARIPDRTWFKISKKEHVAEPMWLLFQNPSKVRGDVTELQRLADQKKDARDLESQREHEREVRSAQEAEQRQLEYAKKEKLRTAERAAEEEAREQRQRDKASSERTSTIVGFGVFAAFGIFLLVASILGQREKDAERDADKPKPECDDQNLNVCLDIAAASAAGGHYDDAVKDYETACNGGVSRACSAADALCTSLKASLDTRLEHYENYCTKNVFSECVLAGTMYATANGDGLGRDEPKAAGLFKKACDGGDADGCQALAASCKRGVKEACPAHVDAGHKH
jgi:LSD1 subclass zinc finger protein